MKKLLQFLFSIILVFSLTACVENVDFNQFEDLEATPSYEGSVLYLEATEEVINLLPGNNVFSQNFSFGAFSSEIFSSRVIDGTLTYVIENTTSKELEIVAELLDINGNITDIQVFSIQPAPTPITTQEVPYGGTGRSIDIIKTLSTIRITATNLGNNVSVSSIPDPLVTLKSSGKFRLRLK